MGGDGGQTIDRATMVKTRGWGLTKESSGGFTASLGEMNSYLQMVTEDRGMGQLQRRATALTTCRLSQQPLQDPIVACRLGSLYNKEALIGALLAKDMPKELSHIRALKDVRLCKIEWREAEKEDSRRRMVCPLSRADLDVGGSTAAVIWPSGAVVEQKALKEVKSTECPVTGKPFDRDMDVVLLAPDAKELEKLRERLPAQRKRKVPGGDAVAPPAAGSPTADATAASGSGDKPSQAKGDAQAKDSDVYKRLFRKSTEGFTGTRDAFGTPSINTGTRI